MSQAIINTPGVPSGESFSPAKSHWAAVIVGVAIASVLGYGSALVATGHLPWVGHQVEIPLTAEAPPAAQAGVVSSGVVDPSEAQVATAAAPAAVGVVDGMSREMVTHSALDAFELRSALAAIEVGSGSIAPHSALDPFELRNGIEFGRNPGSPEPPMSGTGNPRPAFE